MASVELRGLTKHYGANAVVDDVSLTDRARQRWSACSGPSGCGKTTTLRLIAGFVEPTGGEIRVGERVVSSPSAVAAAGAAQHVDDLPELRVLGGRT